MRMPGNLIGLQIGGTFVDCETSCEVAFETDLLAASPQSSGGWKEYIAGVKSWTITLNAGMLMRMAGTGFNTVLNAFLTGQPMDIKVTTKKQDLYPNFTISGSVYLQSGGFSAAVNSLASWNATLQGNGAMSASINDNIVYAISTNLDDSSVLQDGKGNIVAGSNGDGIVLTLVENDGIFETTDTGQVYILIPHGLSAAPTYFNVEALSEGAINLSWSELTSDSSYIRIKLVFTMNNSQILRYSWEAKL